MDAKLGAFSGAVDSHMEELRRSADAAIRAEPYLTWQEQFLQPVRQRLREGNHELPDGDHNPLATLGVLAQSRL